MDPVCVAHSCEVSKFAPVSRVDLAFGAVTERLSTSFLCTDMSERYFGPTVSCLQKRFGLERFFRGGSYEAGTNVLGLSGVDYFAVLTCIKPGDGPNRWASAIAREITRTFPTTEGIHVTERGVQVPFSGGRERVVIVPAIYQGISAGLKPVYLIPDRRRGWQLTSPDGHLERLGKIEAVQGHRLKSMIRLIKLWKMQQEVEIESYYLDCVATSFFERTPIGSYSYGFSRFLTHLRESRLADVANADGVDGLVAPNSTNIAKIVAQSKVEKASELAYQAMLHERSASLSAAFDKWRSLFAGHFPRYASAI